MDSLFVIIKYVLEVERIDSAVDPPNALLIPSSIWNQFQNH